MVRQPSDLPIDTDLPADRRSGRSNRTILGAFTTLSIFAVETGTARFWETAGVAGGGTLAAAAGLVPGSL